MLTQQEHIKKQRGERLRVLRESLFFTRRRFADKHHLSYSTLQNWEDGRFGGLTERGTLVMMKLFEAEGIHTTFDWLYNGEGPSPLQRSKKPLLSNATSISDAIQAELELFYQHHPNAIHAEIISDSMQPRFNRGERVAGVKQSIAAIKNYYNQDCIFLMKTNKKLIGRLINTNSCSHQFVEILQLNFATIEKVHMDDIVSIAPIVWIRAKIQCQKDL